MHRLVKEAAMGTTMRKNRQMTLNRRNLLSHVNHDVREEFEVGARGHQKIRLMNHRLKQMIRKNLLIHRMIVNHLMTLSLLIRGMQRGVLGALHVNRKIRLMLNLRKMRKIHLNCRASRKNHLNCRVSRKNHRIAQLQTDFRKSLFQLKHPQTLNEQTSLQTSHLFNLYP
jgi:Na+/pantothenate symporter